MLQVSGYKKKAGLKVCWDITAYNQIILNIMEKLSARI